MTDEKLMRYLDGELPPGEARRLEREMTDADRAKLESLRMVGDVVRDRYEREANAVEDRLSAMWGALEAKLDRPEPAAKTPVIAVTPEWAKPRVPAAQAAARPGFMSKWGTGLAAMASAAAGALIALSLTSPSGTPTERIVYVTEPAAETTATAAYEPPQVESLEVTGGTGSIFTVPGTEDESPTTVIWVSSDDAPSEEPI